MLHELHGVARALTRLREPSATEILKRFLEVEGEYMAAGGPGAGADFDAFMPLLAEDATMRQARHLPYGGDLIGHAGFARSSPR